MNHTTPISTSESQRAVQAKRAHPSAMRARFGWLAELLSRRVFSCVVINERAVEKIRELSQRGTVVYVLRNRSFMDYVMVNYVLRREGLPLPVFANGVSSTLLAPMAEIIERLRSRLLHRLHRRKSVPAVEDHDYCARAVSVGDPVLVFMRGRRAGGLLGSWLYRRGGSMRRGADYLRELVHTRTEGGSETFIVPLAPFRGHSFRRRESGISALVYSVQEAPSETRRLFTYWWNRNDLFITVGKEVALGEFVARYAEDSEERLVRRLRRAIQIFLHREERVVLGPALLPRRQVKTLVLENDEMAQGIREIAERRQVPVSKVRKEAEKSFDEMAADFNGILFGIIAYVFKKIWDRMFSGLEVIGFDEVVEKVRHHPVVLVPCHRSHFDYLILSYLFHMNFVSPPHIAAGINMAFPPMGPLFRAVGAFFIRRSFGDDDLYKLLFRQYLTFLIREGYTQEFFIEGGRSRTGKIMTPKLGMLSAIVHAYLGGVRRDIYLVPVSIHYGRIAEEETYKRELTGASKETESISALWRARRFLKQKFGTVYIAFAEPISLATALGDRRHRFIEGAGVPEIEDEQRRFIQKLGFRILRDVNDCSVAGATSISATVMLTASHAGKRYADFAAQANALLGLVEQQNITPTASLQRNAGEFRESMAFLSGNGLIQIIHRGREEILVVPDNKRLPLDFYKNNLIHAVLIPSLISFCLLTGKQGDMLAEEVWWWLDLFRYEFALPAREELGPLIEGLMEYFRLQGALTATGIDRAHPLVRATAGVLDNFRESYWVTSRSVWELLPGDGMTYKAFLEEIRKSYEASLLLGEVLKQEGATVVLFGNALSRLAELGYVRMESGGRGGREQIIHRGPEHSAMAAFVERLENGVLKGRLTD